LNIAVKFQRVEALARQLLIRKEKNIKAAPKAAKKEGTGR
jgi:hypothetical protein